VDEAALGFRHHTGWAAMVLIAGPADSPTLLDRRRVELCDPGLPVQVYHAADGLDPAAAGELVERVTSAARGAADRVLVEALAAARAKGTRVGAAGMVAEVRAMPALKAILASHMLAHSAEGELYRDALGEAVDAHGLRLVLVSSRGVRAQVVAARPSLESGLDGILTEFGKAAGPPWRKDHKEAALAALLALGATSDTR
jgi:hypothetical protein